MESLQSYGGSIDGCAGKRKRCFIHEDYKALNGLESLFGKPPFSNLVFVPLSDAISTWKCSEDINRRDCSSKINLFATVVKWGALKQTKGKHISKRFRPVTNAVYKAPTSMFRQSCRMHIAQSKHLFSLT